MTNVRASAELPATGREATAGQVDERTEAPAWPRQGRPFSSSPAATLAGIGVLVLGFVCLTLTWVQVADETNVARQTPYVVSGGFFGLALVMTGLLVINVATKRQDAAERGRQMRQLTAVVSELRRTLEGLDE